MTDYSVQNKTSCAEQILRIHFFMQDFVLYKYGAHTGKVITFFNHCEWKDICFKVALWSFSQQVAA